MDKRKKNNKNRENQIKITKLKSKIKTIKQKIKRKLQKIKSEKKLFTFQI